MSKTGYIDYDGEWQRDDDYLDARAEFDMEEPIPLTDEEEYDLLEETADDSPEIRPEAVRIEN